MDANENISARLKQWMEDEARSCSMDFGCITPLYVYRMWGGSVAIEEFASALKELRSQGYTGWRRVRKINIKINFNSCSSMEEFKIRKNHVYMGNTDKAIEWMR